MLSYDHPFCRCQQTKIPILANEDGIFCLEMKIVLILSSLVVCFFFLYFSLRCGDESERRCWLLLISYTRSVCIQFDFMSEFSMLRLARIIRSFFIVHHKRRLSQAYRPKNIGCSSQLPRLITSKSSTIFKRFLGIASSYILYALNRYTLVPSTVVISCSATKSSKHSSKRRRQMIKQKRT